jgi:SAM-dependent methyltransferase
VIDADELMAEITAEVRSRREAGDLPADFERDLDLAFARFAPAGAMGDDLESVAVRAEQAAFLDLATPPMTGPPGIPYVKRVLRKLMFFYVHHIAEQITTLALVLTRGLRVLGKRVDRLERVVPGTGSGAGLAPPALPDLKAWERQLLDALGDVRGRVLHAGCGDGAIVAALRGSGVDAYGVEPAPGAAGSAEAAGLELRPVDSLDHLRVVGAGALGGLVLTGCVDRSIPAFQRELAELAASRLAAGGRLALVGTGPVAWERTVGPVAADLAPGRPLHPETWVALLEAAGFSGLEIHRGAVEDGLAPVPGSDPTAAAVNANLERLNGLLFGPASYCVVGVAPGPR